MKLAADANLDVLTRYAPGSHPVTNRTVTESQIQRFAGHSPSRFAYLDCCLGTSHNSA